MPNLLTSDVSPASWLGFTITLTITLMKYYLQTKNAGPKFPMPDYIAEQLESNLALATKLQKDILSMALYSWYGDHTPDDLNHGEGGINDWMDNIETLQIKLAFYIDMMNVTLKTEGHSRQTMTASTQLTLFA